MAQGYIEGAGMEKYFIITIDTEGDNIWQRVTTRTGMREITVENAKYIERFQLLCEKYHFIPTYLVNYEMASADPFVSKAKEWVANNRCEVGMHMHAWNTPPIVNLPFNPKGHNPYAGEYSHEVLWKKMCTMTRLIERNFGVKPTSHRGGRWYIDAWYIRALLKLGYKVDCSVTPGISWTQKIGNRMYGPDYSKFPNNAYYMDRKDINQKARFYDKDNNILQVPPTIIPCPLKEQIKKMIDKPEQISSICREKIWLRSKVSNLNDMLYIVKHTEKRDYIEYMLHSSELMPGGNPNFKTDASIEKLYRDLEVLFSEIAKKRKGISLSEYAMRDNKKIIL